MIKLILASKIKWKRMLDNNIISELDINVGWRYYKKV